MRRGSTARFGVIVVELRRPLAQGKLSKLDMSLVKIYPRFDSPEADAVQAGAVGTRRSPKVAAMRAFLQRPGGDRSSGCSALARRFSVQAAVYGSACWRLLLMHESVDPVKGTIVDWRRRHRSGQDQPRRAEFRRMTR